MHLLRPLLLATIATLGQQVTAQDLFCDAVGVFAASLGICQGQSDCDCYFDTLSENDCPDIFNDADPSCLVSRLAYTLCGCTNT
jgi:hypothetical protein